jgi:hypothetical protein
VEGQEDRKVGSSEGGSVNAEGGLGKLEGEKVGRWEGEKLGR